MVDFHAHILPDIDDGSKSVEESLTMLNLMREQGVSTVIATPHFYANDESVDAFISRRQIAFETLKRNVPDHPEILLGAEVRYYDGISHLTDLKKLRIENSKFLLIEMPFNQWTEYAVRELLDIASRGKITPVLAHIERYLYMQKKDVLPRLLSNGVLLQANASFLIEHRYRRKAIKMLKENQIHFLGSDCHNMTDRVPNMAKATSLLQNRCSEGFIADYFNYVNELFTQNRII